MKIFIDFDDVIFNTKQFIADREEIFKNHGIKQEIFNRYIKKLREKEQNEKSLMQYSLEEHIKDIESENNIDSGELRKDLSELIKNAKDYIFDEFKKFAQKIGKENLILVSHGNIHFQETKIAHSGVKDYFDNVIITDIKKTEALPKELLKKEGENYYFIDDRIKHLKDIKENFPEFTTLLVIPEDSRHKEEKEDKKGIEKYCDGVVGSLKEIVAFLEAKGEIFKEQNNESVNNCR
jgi:FMN phosphatase YigB (HAD superfamily)